MKNKSMWAMGIAAGIVSLGVTAATFGTVFAQTQNQGANGTTQNFREDAERPLPPMMQNVQRSVQNIDNGIQITLTSTDAATVQKLQSFKHPTPPQNDQMASKITVNQTNISNGVQITVTSTDPAIVTKLQTGAQNGKGFGLGFGMMRGFGHHRGMGMGMIFGDDFGTNVQRSEQNISNGVQITITSTDPATVQKLQDKFQHVNDPLPTPPSQNSESQQ